MEKVTLSIFDCKPGMRLAQTIHNEFGAVIIKENTILDRQIIDRIQSLDSLEVDIFVEDTVKIKDNDEKNIKNKYEQNVETMKTLIDRVRKGVPLDMARVREITQTILSGVYASKGNIGPLAQATNAEEYLYTHSINVAFMAMTIGKWMGCSERTIKHLVLAGLLHDIGKSKIPKNIIDKPGTLTEKEYDLMKQHPRYGYDILNDIDSIHKDVLMGILTHHEREDGTGYPLKLTSEKINLIGKILAVADIYDAMTSTRVYKKGQSPFEVFELMQNGSFGKLHPVILEKFIKNMAEYYNGSTVLLSNGMEGEVVFINYNKISKPIVKVDNQFIDLSLAKNLKII